MAYPQPGATGVRGTIDSLFVYGSLAGSLAGTIFGGIVRARYQDWELPNATDMTYFYQSPLCFEFYFTALPLSEGQAVTFDVVAGDFAAYATNLQIA